MGLEAPSHWIIIALIVIALFGYKKMPDAARSIGRSLRIFKGEMKQMTEHETASDVAPSAPVSAAPDAAESATRITTPVVTVGESSVNGATPSP